MTSPKHINRFAFRIAAALLIIAIIPATSSASGDGKIYLDNFANYAAKQGEDIELTLNQAVYFKTEDQEHSITLIETGPDYANLRIASEPQEVRISLSQAQEVSASGNGSKDLRISLKTLDSGKATLNFTKVTTSPIAAAASTPSNIGGLWWLFLLVISVGYFLAIHKAPHRQSHKKS